MSNPFEDFSECHNLFLNHQNVFVALAQDNPSLEEKYTYLHQLYGGKYFSNSELAIHQLDVTWRPWDSTRILE